MQVSLFHDGCLILCSQVCATFKPMGLKKMNSRLISILAMADVSLACLLDLPSRNARQSYSPCIKCGKTTRGGHCYTCKTKETEKVELQI